MTKGVPMSTLEYFEEPSVTQGISQSTLKYFLVPLVTQGIQHSTQDILGEQSMS